MDDEARFLAAWKRGAAIAGPRYFGRGDPSAATTKWDLRPDRDAIGDALGVLSTGEAVFLTAMYCFFNDTDGAEMLKRAYGVEYAVGIGTVAAVLDDTRRSVVAELLLSYRGW